MTTYAILQDVVDRFRPLTSDEQARVPALLEEASAKLRALVANLDALVGSDPDKALLAKAAVANAVQIVLVNPGMLRQTTQAAGAFSESGTFNDAAASGLLRIDPADLVGLVPTTSVGAIPAAARIRSGYPPPQSGRRLPDAWR